MVERICGVVVCYWEGEAIRRFLAIADGVVLVGAVAGVDAAVCSNDLTEGVVAPEPARECWVGGAAGGDSGALTYGVHGIVITGDDGGANSVLLEVEDVAVWLPAVGDGVDRAGDSSGEVGVGSVGVREELIWDKRIGDLRDAAIGGGVGIRGLCFDDGGGGSASTDTRGGCAPQDKAGVAIEGIAAAVEGAGELVEAVRVEVVVGGFEIEPEIGGVVGVADPALVGLGDGGGAAEAIPRHADVWGGVCVVDVGDFSKGIGGVESGEANS